ncbi:hypothetical protein CTA1_11866 [Colletotrichum tanaceti]|uniref:Uncharacterized protein n=1 Tax=Colletotrichum tanaceti TaxID=1306861 RepID=A0A4U6XIY3_9PEZI|nr:hypothetical protein CTA1_11866 [Colletotrichum tanaceti]
MMDEEFADLPSRPTDSNLYSFGRIGVHNIVAACLPASQIKNSFPSLRFSVLVSISGSVPNLNKDINIRLSDVIISQPSGLHSGVIQYDYSKTRPDGRIARIRSLNAPPAILLHALAKRRANHLQGKTQALLTHLSKISSQPRFASPGPENDMLYKAPSLHIGRATYAECRSEDRVDRDARATPDPVLFFSNIASGNQVMKDSQTRDRYSQELGGVLCFKIEAAGLMNTLPCIVIRGICDYADAHKNERWQSYAAATAAAYAKELLHTIPPLVSRTPIRPENYKPSGQNASNHRRPETILDMPNEAEKLCKELEQRKAVRGVKHPDTIKIMIELARTYEAQGRYDEAEKLKIEALKLRQEVFRKRDPSTI